MEIGAYMYALFNANLKVMVEELAVVRRGLPFDKLMEEMGLDAKWRAEGEKIGWERAIELMKQGYTVEELKRMSPPPKWWEKWAWPSIEEPKAKPMVKPGAKPKAKKQAGEKPEVSKTGAHRKGA
jgi:hypothetical protein